MKLFLYSFISVSLLFLIFVVSPDILGLKANGAMGDVCTSNEQCMVDEPWWAAVCCRNDATGEEAPFPGGGTGNCTGCGTCSACFCAPPPGCSGGLFCCPEGSINEGFCEPSEADCNPAPPTPCADAGGSCSSGSGCGYGYQDIGMGLADCGWVSCCVPVPTDCSDQGGSCNASCGAEEDSVAGTAECGSQNCCVPIPNPCQDAGGTCSASCVGGSVSFGGLGYGECTGNYCCVPPDIGSILAKVFYDTDKDGYWDTGEAAVSGRTVGVGAQAFPPNYTQTGITNAQGQYQFNDLNGGNYDVGIIDFPSGYDVLNGQRNKTVYTGRTVPLVTVNFPLVPIGRRLDKLTIDADSEKGGVAQGVYSMTGIKAEELNGLSYYNPVKITQEVRVDDVANRSKVALVGVAFGKKNFTPAPATLTQLTSATGAVIQGNGFVMLYAFQNVGAPAATVCGKTFCSKNYYFFFKGTWEAKSIPVFFWGTDHTSYATFDKSTQGLKVIGRYAYSPLVVPDNMYIRFNAYMYKILGSKDWTTYGYMSDTDGLETIEKKPACPTTGSCTLE